MHRRVRSVNTHSAGSAHLTLHRVLIWVPTMKPQAFEKGFEEWC